MKDKNNSQKGSALFLILIAVALFAALSYSVAQMLQGGDGGTIQDLNEQEAQLYAGEILDYGRSLKQAVQDLRISNGCSETQISFENDSVAGYENPNAPSDRSCHIFDPAGGGLNWVDPPRINIRDNAEYTVSNRSSILNIGSDCGGSDNSCQELFVALRSLDRAACLEYNKAVGVSNIGDDAPVEIGLNFSTKFTGSYIPAANILGDDNDGANFAGQPIGCYRDATESFLGDPYYDFYQVLVTR